MVGVYILSFPLIFHDIYHILPFKPSCSNTYPPSIHLRILRHSFTALCAITHTNSPCFTFSSSRSILDSYHPCLASFAMSSPNHRYLSNSVRSYDAGAWTSHGSRNSTRARSQSSSINLYSAKDPPSGIVKIPKVLGLVV